MDADITVTGAVRAAPVLEAKGAEMTEEGSFGLTLRKLRKEKRFSQEEFAKKINVLYPSIRMSQTTMSSLEQRILPPKDDILRALCDLLDVNPGHFGAATPDSSRYVRWLAVCVLDTAYFHAAGQREDFLQSLERARKIARDIIE